MKYAAEKASGGTIFIPSFMTISSGVQTFLRGIHRHTHMRLLLFFQNNESKLKTITGQL
jgi:hypothetical protein